MAHSENTQPHRSPLPHGQKDRPGAAAGHSSTKRPDGATQALNQEQDAVQQMGEKAKLHINEGGRTNDSHETHNPEGAVHGLPKPALKGTWR